jgi:hypothetical protein
MVFTEEIFVTRPDQVIRRMRRDGVFGGEDIYG